MTNTFKNDSIEVLVTRGSGCKVTFEVTTLSPAIQKAKKEAIKEINKNVSIPGFRKGKAPDDLIVKNFGQAVEEETKKALANIAFTQAQELTKNFPMQHSSISYNVKSLNLPTDAKLNFTFESDPIVPKIDPKSFKLEKIDLPVVDEVKVDEAIRQLLFFYADWQEITDRGIEEGDYVLLDMESLETTPPTKIYSNVRFEVKDGKIANWMNKLLIGAKKDDVIDGVSEPDQNLSEEEKTNFSSKKVRLKINLIEAAKLPDLTDEFVKKLGVQTVEDLKQSVRKRLNKQVEDEFDKKKRLQVNKFLYETYPFDLPEAMVNAEIKYRMTEVQKERDFNKLTENEKKNIEETIKEEGKRAIALFFLTKQAVQDFNLNITNEDLMKERPFDLTTSKKRLSTEEMGMLYSRALLKKVQDFILSSQSSA